MTQTFFKPGPSRGNRHRIITLTQTLALTLAAALLTIWTLPAEAGEHGPYFGKRRDRNVTVIIIDPDSYNDGKVFLPESKRNPKAATTFKKADDEIRIRIPRRTSKNSSRRDHERTGPKVIIVESGRDGACGKRSGVCVIRP